MELSAYLEISLRAAPAGYAAELRAFAPSGGARGAPVVAAGALAIDAAALRELELQPAEYGRLLARMLFADVGLQKAWLRACTEARARGSLLRVGLRIEPDAAALHGLGWERLCDPDDGTPLAQSDWRLLARVANARHPGELPPLDPAALRALVIYANPRDAARFGVPHIAEPAVLAEALAALDGLDTTVLGDWPSADGPATPAAILRRLRSGAYPIVYLLAHGVIRDLPSRGLAEHPFLLLEREGGSHGWAPGGVLAQQIGELPAEAQPRLIILGSCASASPTDAARLPTALAPALVHHGVPAVLGMQGQAPAALLRRIVPPFLADLRQSGRIDQALARARAEVAVGDEEAPWHAPVLFLRAGEHQLFVRPAPVDPGPAARSAEQALSLVGGMLAGPRPPADLAAMRAECAAVRDQLAALTSYKARHDLLHTIQFQCLSTLEHDIAPKFPSGRTLAQLHRCCDDLDDCLDELRRELGRATPANEEHDWLQELGHCADSLHRAADSISLRAFNEALGSLESVLGRYPTWLHEQLRHAAQALRLDQLAALLRRTVRVADAELPELLAGARALEQLHRELQRRVEEHGDWQYFDGAIRTLKFNQKPAHVWGFWLPVRKAVEQRLAPRYQAASDQQVQRFLRRGRELDGLMAAIGQTELGELQDALKQLVDKIDDYYANAGSCFFRVDRGLLDFCGELKLIRERIDATLGLIT